MVGFHEKDYRQFWTVKRSCGAGTCCTCGHAALGYHTSPRNCGMHLKRSGDRRMAMPQPSSKNVHVSNRRRFNTLVESVVPWVDLGNKIWLSSNSSAAAFPPLGMLYDDRMRMRYAEGCKHSGFHQSIMLESRWTCAQLRCMFLIKSRLTIRRESCFSTQVCCNMYTPSVNLTTPSAGQLATGLKQVSLQGRHIVPNQRRHLLA